MPPPFSNQEYVLSGATSATQLVNGTQNVVILTNGTQGLAALKRLAKENHEGWKIIHVDATKPVHGETLHDAGAEGEGAMNRAAAINMAAGLKNDAGSTENTLFIINCKAGRVRSVTLAIHLRMAYLSESGDAAYQEMEFATEPTEAIAGRIKAGL